MRTHIGFQWFCAVLLCAVLGCSEATQPNEEVAAAELDRESEGVAVIYASMCHGCHGFIQLLYDGTLRVLPVGGSELRVAEVTNDELVSIQSLAGDPELIEYLESLDPTSTGECAPWPTETIEDIYLTVGSKSLQKTARCSEMARELANRLTSLQERYAGD